MPAKKRRASAPKKKYTKKRRTSSGVKKSTKRRATAKRSTKKKHSYPVKGTTRKPTPRKEKRFESSEARTNSLASEKRSNLEPDMFLRAVGLHCSEQVSVQQQAHWQRLLEQLLSQGLSLHSLQRSVLALATLWGSGLIQISSHPLDCELRWTLFNPSQLQA